MKLKKNVLLNVIRKANDKLISKHVQNSNVVSDNSKNGDIIFTVNYFDKEYHVFITKEEIRQAFRKSRLKITKET